MALSNLLLIICLVSSPLISLIAGTDVKTSPPPPPIVVGNLPSTPPAATTPTPPTVSPPPKTLPPPAVLPPPKTLPPPTTTPLPPPTVFPPLIDCGGACAARCRLSSRPNLCKRACGTCCIRCKCVPSGTSGHYEECPCYANQTTHGGRPKCP